MFSERERTDRQGIASIGSGTVMGVLLANAMPKSTVMSAISYLELTSLLRAGANLSVKTSNRSSS